MDSPAESGTAVGRGTGGVCPVAGGSVPTGLAEMRKEAPKSGQTAARGA
ncbi:MAG: hypothetical protein LBT40_04640 [Deltaproteobacteria bacterium]|nr:hypothetical protein [Deltaproteobacteria bacterium]